MRPKLTAPPPLVAKLPPAVAQSPADEAERSRYRARTEQWRKWEKTKRWALLREAVFLRDNFICQRTGVLCAGKHPAPNSPVAHHKIRHGNDPALFWDKNNIITVTKAVHDREIQAEERRGYSSAVGQDGWPIDQQHPANQS